MGFVPSHFRRQDNVVIPQLLTIAALREQTTQLISLLYPFEVVSLPYPEGVIVDECCRWNSKREEMLHLMWICSKQQGEWDKQQRHGLLDSGRKRRCVKHEAGSKRSLSLAPPLLVIYPKRQSCNIKGIRLLLFRYILNLPPPRRPSPLRNLSTWNPKTLNRVILLCTLLSLFFVDHYMATTVVSSE